MEIPGNYKFILIWFSDCSPPQKSSFVQFLSHSFWVNWVLNLCCNFQSCILMILPNNLYKSPYQTAFAFFRSFASVRRFFLFFSNAVFTFETALLATPNNSVVFVTLAPAIWSSTIWPLLKSDRCAILMNFDLFLLMVSVKKKTILVK